MKSVESSKNLYNRITHYAILCIAFLICVFNPYALYATDITQFDSTQTLPTLCALFGAFLISSFIVIYLISFIPKRFAKIPAFIFSLTLFIGLIYSFILVGDYGAMDHFVLQKTPFDDRDALTVKAREFVAVVALGAIFIALALQKLLRLWQIILITLFIVSAVNATNIALKRLDSARLLDSNKITKSSVNSSIVDEKSGLRSYEQGNRTDGSLTKRVASLPDLSPQDEFTSAPPHLPYAESSLFSYSKSHKNIVVIVLDSFSGSHTKHIFTQFPHLKTALDGFTLFPNALSTTDSTIHSIATLIGGEHYALYNMNARKPNLAQEIDKAFIDTTNAFANGDFGVSLMAFVGSDIEHIKPKLHSYIYAISAYSGIFNDFYIHKENLLDNYLGIRDKVKNIQLKLLLSFGLFKFAPEFIFRDRIYNNSLWLLDGESREMLNVSKAISYSASFYALTHIARTDSSKPTFKFIHSMMTHSPFGAYFDGTKCAFFDNKTAYDDYPHNIALNTSGGYNYQHYDAEVCALHYLVDYIKLLKNLGIYDNTQIFVVSDHSASDNINIPIQSNPDALFLFKDFGESGAVRTDNRLMANYDIASIFCANLPSGCPSVGQNILQNYPQNREIIHTIPLHWRLEAHKPNEWLIRKAFKVKGDIYKAENWREIDEIVNVK